MHLVEQLHTKRTDAHRHLLSRKRKLAELFAATVGTGDLPPPPPTQHYLKQLQAFQDANDVVRGRFLNESSLPPRRPISQQPRAAIAPPAQSHVTRSETSHTVPNGSAGDAPLVSSTPVDSHVKSTIPIATVTATSNDLSHARADSHGRPQDIKSTQGDGQGTGSELSPLDDGSGKKSHRSSANTTSLQQPPQPDISVHKPTYDRAVSTHDPSIANATEPQSSPASTNGAASSHTPVPTVPSPTTSVGVEDLSSGSAILDMDKDNGQSAVQGPHTPEAAIAPRVRKLSVSSLDVDTTDIDPSTAFDSPAQPTVPKIQIQREASSRAKPDIRVDTKHELGAAFRPPAITSGALVETPAPITGTGTPHLTTMPTPVSAIDPSKRATRISSGALQKKSVSEILGETSKSVSPFVDSPSASSLRDSFIATTAAGRQADRERKDKERSKLSTVVFAKPQRLVTDVDTIEVAAVSTTAAATAATVHQELERVNPEDRDYLYTLFESKAYTSKSGNLSHLIQHAHKTVTTADHLIDYEYQAQCRVLKRLYQLQSAERWALRQRKRADEPARQTSHWDFLLDHAKWMRTDFREERKWKHAAAQTLAEACAEWVQSSPEDRKLLQVRCRNVKNRTSQADASDVDMEDAGADSHPTPELLPSGEDDSVSEDIADPRDINLTTAPAAIFSLGASDFSFFTDKTPAFDKIINELPLYEPAKIEPDLAKSNLAERLDARWKTDIVPISRFAVEKLKYKEPPPLFEKSRYEFELETLPSTSKTTLPPRATDVGLFMPENKHIRDRIHPGHSFRPPSEYPMPTQAFFETRASSQWTPAEDDELRKLVKDYSYNWSLISSCLSPKSLFTSSADRRTPWECFERWVGLEGMPADMAKTPYFRTYSGRIEAAGQRIQAQIEEAQRRAGTTAPVAVRKRTGQPVRVERKRAQRHLAMLDAMRKLAKKREAMRQKQQASAEMAAVRKTNEMNNQQRPPLKTPAEWSQLKHEREQKLAKQQELYRQQLIAHQRAATQQQQRGPNTGPNGVPNGMPLPNGAVRGPNGVPVPMANGHLAVPNGMTRPHPSMFAASSNLPNGMGGHKGMQAQPQPHANMRGPMAGSPQQVRMQEQLMRQAQQNANHSSPNGQHANVVNGHNQTHMGDAAGVNGHPPGSSHGANSTSPRQPGIGQALSSGVVPVLTQIAANIKQRHPNMSDEEIQRAASQQLTTWQQQATAAAAGHAAAGQTPRPRVNQAALNAALGAANAAAHAGNMAAAAQAQAAAAANGGYPQNPGMMSAEQLQQYNQRIRLQQAQQHAARGMQNQLTQGMMNQMASSPAMNIARPVSQHAHQPALSRSATPRDQRAGSASTVNAGPSPINNGGNAVPMNGVSQT